MQNRPRPLSKRTSLPLPGLNSRQTPAPLDRRKFIRHLAGLSAAAVAVASPGCIAPQGTTGTVDLVWGRRGLSEGRFQKPRAIAIDADDQLYIVDTTGRIQIFSADGEYLRGWKTPDAANGRPTGLEIDNASQRLLVADTHYFQLLSYSLDGRLMESETLGGTQGTGGGEFSFITDAVRDSAGNYYTGEYSDIDRIQKFSPTGEFLMQWGSTGTEPGQFVRPQSLAIDRHDHIWVADSCNHRIQVFDANGPQAKLVRTWGEFGHQPGQLYYPYGITLSAEEDCIYVCEYGNDRIQKFDREGRSLAVWGRSGHAAGELFQPWGVVRDSRGRLHVLDSNNHRVQRVWL
ncbi:Serine/threonine-protein kinase PknD [Rosistilla ulvae]|uniref:Serine/threonine-protein kinase PknD n=1 Tax=Rosistilla ulvae TaxID=1930277 RepID=A0A517M683_9BACT|nr:SMP-30/gluconolactonase/LRE family protein [Rosistilla ulvae]QDS90367.1 Serine/threonine-protein kinase PknD [Rosistilla ulvae]